MKRFITDKIILTYNDFIINAERALVKKIVEVVSNNDEIL